MEPIDGEPEQSVTGDVGPPAGRPPLDAVLGTCAVPATPAEVAPTRHWLADLLSKDHAAIADDVVLLACETLTNAIRHSDSRRSSQNGEPGTVTVAVFDLRDAVRVEVTDAGSATSVPTPAQDDPESVNGRGLHLLDLVSGGHWGWRADGGHARTVWFEITARERDEP